MTELNPDLDLELTRVIDVPPEFVWAAWTKPEHIVKWFTPAPWTTVACEIDLRPGGRFRTVMRSPEGQDFPNQGCYLEIVEDSKLVWTSAMDPGFRPRDTSKLPLVFTAIIALKPEGSQTKYVARVMHIDSDSREKHEAMGFHVGLNKGLDQLVALAKSI